MEGADEAGAEITIDSKDLQQQSKAFDKLTDRVEDRQLDSSRVQSAMASIAASREADLNAKRLREKEMASVKINPADVEIIVNELELEKNVVERRASIQLLPRLGIAFAISSIVDQDLSFTSKVFFFVLFESKYPIV